MIHSCVLLAATVLIGLSVSHDPSAAAPAPARVAARPTGNIEAFVPVSDTVHAWLDTATLRRHLRYPKSSLASGTGGIATMRYGIGAHGTANVLSMHCGGAGGDSAQFCEIVSAAMKGVKVTSASINGNEVDESLILSVLFSVDRTAKTPRPVFDIVLVRVLGPVPHIINSSATPHPQSGSASAPMNSNVTDRAGNGMPPQAPSKSGGDEVLPTYDEQDLLRRLHYPETARRNNLEGRVVVRALIGKDGRVEKTMIDQAADPLFNDAALDAVRNTRFTPAMDKGAPVKVWIQIPVDFSFNK